MSNITELCRIGDVALILVRFECVSNDTFYLYSVESSYNPDSLFIRDIKGNVTVDIFNSLELWRYGYVLNNGGIFTNLDLDIKTIARVKTRFVKDYITKPFYYGVRDGEVKVIGYDCHRVSTYCGFNFLSLVKEQVNPINNPEYVDFRIL